MLLQKPSTEANKLANSQGPRRSEQESIEKDSCFPPNAKTLISNSLRHLIAVNVSINIQMTGKSCQAENYSHFP